MTQRPIKFRAWQKTHKYMTNDMTLRGFHPDEPVYLRKWTWYYTDPEDGIIMVDDWEVMQFTGLLDKNGKEIYEGDVLRAPYYGIGVIGVMEWSQEQAGYFVSDKPGSLDCVGFGDTAIECRDYFEIIGNIYENPELLKV